MAYSATSALHEYMLSGEKVSLLEAILIFGVQGPNQAIFQLKKKGFLIKSQRVPMVKVLKRINEMAVCKVPSNLPVEEITVMEYWVSQ